MGEKGRVNTALTIMGVTGALVVYSAFNEKFKVPPEAWTVATIASAYYFTTARRDSSKINKGNGKDESD